MNEIPNWVDTLPQAPTELVLRFRRELSRVLADCDFTLARRTLAAQTPPPESNRYLTIAEVAERTGLSKSHLYELGRRGILPVRAMGQHEGGKRPRGFRILLSDLKAWEASLGRNAVDERLARVLGSTTKDLERRP